MKNPDLTSQKLLKLQFKKNLFFENLLSVIPTSAGFFRVSHRSWVSTF